jgi:hypothetical protein
MADQPDADPPRFPAMKRCQKGRSNEIVRNNGRFDDFARLQGIHPLNEYTMESVQERDETGKLLLEQTFSEYATYVKQLTFDKKGGEIKSHGYGSMLKIFSTPYDTLANKFKVLDIFRPKDRTNSWWLELYNIFKFQARVACIARGEELEESTTAIRYQELCTIGAELLGKGFGPEVEAYVALSFQRQASGRPGETGLLNFLTCEWKNGGLEVVWGNKKEGRQQRMVFYPDSRGFLLDPYHALGILKLVKPGYHTDLETKDWFFPMLTEYADGGIAGFLTRKIKEVSDDERHTAHGVRAGAADDMLLRNDSMDRIGVFLGAVYRAGWSSEMDCTIFRYLFADPYVALAGKALAGYDHPEQDVATPSIDCLPDGVRPRLNNLALNLFQDTFEGLKELSDCVLASLLMYHDDVVSKFGNKHVIARTLTDNCQLVGIEKAEMKRIGALIKSDVASRNEANLHRVLAKKSSVDREERLLEANRLEALVKENAELKAKVNDVTTELTSVKTTLTGVNTELTEMKGMLGQVLDGMSRLTLSGQPAVPAVLAPDAAITAVPAATTAAATAATTRTTLIVDTPPAAPRPAVMNANEELMNKTKKPALGKWATTPDILQKTPVEEFLLGARLRSLNFDLPTPFGDNVKKQQKSKMKTLHDAAINSAIKSGDIALVAAGQELKSRKRIDASAVNYPDVLGELRRMARLVSSNLERELCDTFSASVYLQTMVSAGNTTATVELVKLHLGFGPKGGCGTVYSFIEKKSSKWNKPWTKSPSKTTAGVTKK